MRDGQSGSDHGDPERVRECQQQDAGQGRLLEHRISHRACAGKAAVGERRDGAPTDLGHDE